MTATLRHHHRILFRVQETSQLAAAHCAKFRRTIAENRKMVAQSIDMILSAKAAMQCADEMLDVKHARPRRSWSAPAVETPQGPATDALRNGTTQSSPQR